MPRDRTTKNLLPRISIVTPTYNSAAYLEQTIQSVLCENYPGVEYTIIDGGSTDGTLEIIRKYERHLAGWISEPDDGISDAFNKGIARATGEMIGIINSDDFYEPGALHAIANAFDPNDADVILHGDLCLRHAEGEQRLRPQLWPGAFYRYMPVFHPTCFVPRGVYERVGTFDCSYHSAMDYDFVLRATRAGIRLQYVEQLIAHFRIGGASNQDLGRGHREVYRSQRQNGLNPVLSAAAFGAKMLISSVKSRARFGIPRAA